MSTITATAVDETDDRLSVGVRAARIASSRYKNNDIRCWDAFELYTAQLTTELRHAALEALFQFWVFPTSIAETPVLIELPDDFEERIASDNELATRLGPNELSREFPCPFCSAGESSTFEDIIRHLDDILQLLLVKGFTVTPALFLQKTLTNHGSSEILNGMLQPPPSENIDLPRVLFTEHGVALLKDFAQVLRVDSTPSGIAHHISSVECTQAERAALCAYALQIGVFVGKRRAKSSRPNFDAMSGLDRMLAMLTGQFPMMPFGISLDDLFADDDEESGSSGAASAMNH